LVLFFKWKRL